MSLLAADLPRSARVVIIGGGIAGTSVAYHLVQAGWTDLVVLEQGRLAGGTTWHAAGMVTRLRVSGSMMRINQASAELYARLANGPGPGTGWREVGSLVLARRRERLTQIRRTTAMAGQLGVEGHLISPREAADRFPLIRHDDLAGAAWIPHDGRCRPADVVLTLAEAARAGGARICEGVRVLRLCATHRHVTGVETTHGPIEAEIVVLAGGMWSRQLALEAGIDVPLYPVEHHYVVSQSLPGAHGGLPCTRDLDGSLYFRGEDPEALVVGAFQRTTKPWDVPRVPDDFSFRLLPEDWPKFAEPLREAEWRIPGLARAGYARFVNGPESFTPDNQWLMGETPGRRGLFVLAGFNSAGIASAGGAGRHLAEWIIDGQPSLDLGAVDIRRFGPWANNRAFLRARVSEALGWHYEMAWPNREFDTGRGMRRSPLHDRLAAAGACFGVKGGWERPNWFAAAGAGLESRPVTEYAFGRQNWFANHAREHRAAREAVAVFDQSGFGKLLVRGPGALALLQHLCANQVDVPAGQLVYTAMLNARGGFEADLVVLRLSSDAFYLVTGTAQAVRDRDWLERHREDLGTVEILDITNACAVLGVMGPNSRALLARLTDTDLGSTAFPFGTAREIDLHTARVRALRITYIGELGWELHVPVEQAASVYEALITTGADLGVTNAGHYAIQSLRLEKGYRALGAELSAEETPLEAGLGFAVDWTKPFLGRAALVRQRERGPRRRLGIFVVQDSEPVLWGGEPIYRDGQPTGYTTSAAYGHTVGASIAMGYVRLDEATDPAALVAARYEILLDGQRVPANLHFRAPVDPDRHRILS